MKINDNQLYFTEEEGNCLQLILEDVKIKLETTKQELINSYRLVICKEDLLHLDQDLKISNRMIDVVDKIKHRPDYLFKIRDAKTVLLTLLLCPPATQLTQDNQCHFNMLRKIEARLLTLTKSNKLVA